jgi:hypothetical protein
MLDASQGHSMLLAILRKALRKLLTFSHGGCRDAACKLCCISK